MINLVCGRDPGRLGIMMSEGGLNITAFLDHLEICTQCGQAKGDLIKELNRLIGEEKEE